MSELPWKTIWITGGSTGIGAELAVRLAEKGAKVAVTARSHDKLELMVQENSNIYAFPADVRDAKALAIASAQIAHKIGAIDLVIFNAGTWEALKISEFDSEIYARIMQVNYQGVVNGIEAVLPDFLSRKSGHIAIVASVAGYCGLPHAAPYGASKAALINLSESLYPELKLHGVKLSLINPGFVDTPMTAENDFPMPFMISSEKAVDHIISGLKREKFEIAFPWKIVALLKFLRVLPYKLFFLLAPKPRK